MTDLVTNVSDNCDSNVGVGNVVITTTVKVTVPESQNGVAAVDDGQSYAILSSCP